MSPETVANDWAPGSGHGKDRAALALTWVLLQPAVGAAQENWEADALLGYATDYVDRGVSQSDGHGSVRGELGWQHVGGFAARVTAASVDFGANQDVYAELNLIAGMEWPIGAAALAATVAYVQFVGAEASQDDDLIEVAGELVHEIDRWRVDLQAVYSPDELGDVGPALYFAAGIGRLLSESLFIRAHGGRQWFSHQDEAGPSYHDWGIELGWTRDRVTCGLSYTDTDIGSACAEICDARLALTLELAL